MNSRTTSLVGLGVAMVGAVFLAMTDNLISSSPFGMVVQVLALGLMVWARATFGKRSFHAAADPTEGGLVTTGPYRFLRHPIYAAATYFIWAGVLSYRSTEAIAVAVLISLGLLLRMIAEEKLLIAAYPEYVEYSTRAKRVIPFLF